MGIEQIILIFLFFDMGVENLDKKHLIFKTFFHKNAESSSSHTFMSQFSWVKLLRGSVVAVVSGNDIIICFFLI